MNEHKRPSLRTLAALGAMLLLALATTSCNVSLPTEMETTSVSAGRGISTTFANDVEGPSEISEPNLPGGADGGYVPPGGEILVPTPTGNRPNGNAWGWYNNIKKPR